MENKTVFSAKFEENNTIIEKLEKAGYIKQIQAGLYAYLEPFCKIIDNISMILKQIFKKNDFYQVHIPILQNANLWQQSGRWDIYGDALFKVNNQEGVEFVINPTNEESIYNLTRLLNLTKNDLPVSFYQISERARNEMRPAYGLVRTKTFILADCYTIFPIKEKAEEFLEKYEQIFYEIADALSLKIFKANHLGHNNTYSFWCESKFNQCHPKICSHCGNSYRSVDFTICPNCGFENLQTVNGIELGDMAINKQCIDNPNFTNTYLAFMGIGVSRLAQILAEKCVTKTGFKWAYKIAPYKVYIIANNTRKEEAEDIYKKLAKIDIDAILDVRGIGIGAKLCDADLLGCPYKVVLGNKTETGCVEIINSDNEKNLIDAKDILKYILEYN